MNKSQKLYSQMIAGALVVSAVVAPTAVGAEETTEVKQSTVPTKATATNNVTLKDIVKVEGLSAGDAVKVYNGDVVIGKATAKGATVDVVISKKFPADVTSVQVTRTAKGEKESEKIDATVDAEVKSEPVTDVTHHNGLKVADTVTVKGVKEKEIIKVYSDAEKKNLIGKAVAKGTSVTVKISKKFQTKDKALDTVEKFYVTRTEVNELESDVHVTEGTTVDLEKTTTVTVEGADATAEINVTVDPKNNARKADTVEIKGLKEKDIVKLYADEEKTTVIGKGTVKKGQTSIKLKVKGDLQTLLKNEEGATTLKPLYFTVKRGDMHTSAAVSSVPPAETASTFVKANVKYENTIKKDTVTVTKLKAKDIVNVYALPTAEDTAADKKVGALLGTAKANKDGVAIVKLKDGFKPALDANGKPVLNADGNVTFADVLVTVTEDSKLESVPADTDKIKVDIEPATAAPTADKIVIDNNVDTKDTVTVKGLKDKDVVKVYTDDTKTTLLGTAKAKSGVAVVTLKEGFPLVEGKKPTEASAFANVFVTVTGDGKTESPILTGNTGVVVLPEEQTTFDVANVKTINNTVSADVVTVSKLKAKDVVTVYTADGKTVIGTATAKDTTVNVTLTENFSKDLDKIKVSVKSYDQHASAITATAGDVTPAAETASKVLKSSQVKAVNNVDADIKDVITVTGLQKADVIKVYSEDPTGKTDAEKKALEIGTATAAKTDVTVEIANGFEATDPADGTFKPVFVTVTSTDLLESPALSVTPGKEAKTQKPAITAISNNVGSGDTVTVGNLEAKAVVTITKPGAEGADPVVVGTATASKAGEVVVTLTEETLAVGTELTVTVKAPNKSVSDAVTKALPKEAKNAKLTSFTVKNNVDTADTVTISGVVKGDTVRLYKAATATEGEKFLEQVAKGTSVTFTLDDAFAFELAENETNKYKSLYATNQSVNSLESDRAEVKVDAEGVSTTLTAKSAKVANNVESEDTVTVTGVVKGDVVNVYETATEGEKPLGTATATGTSVVVKLDAQLGDTVAKVYVERKSKEMRPSTRIEAVVGKQIDASKISVINNVTSKDQVVVTTGGYAEGDVINVYDTTGKKLLKSQTVAAGTTGDVKIALDQQLPTATSTVFVSITSKDTNEGEKVEIEYKEEEVSTALTAADVEIADDKLTTEGSTVAAGDIIKVYKVGATTPLHTFTISADTTAYEFKSGSTKVPLAAGAYQVTITKATKAATELAPAVEYRESERFDVEVAQTDQPDDVKATGVGITGLTVKGLDKAATYTITGPSSYKLEGSFTDDNAAAGAITLTTEKLIKAAGTYTIVVKEAGKTASAPLTFTIEQADKFAGTVTPGVGLETLTLTGVGTGVDVELYSGTTLVGGTFESGTFTATTALAVNTTYTIVLKEEGKLQSAGVSYKTPAEAPEAPAGS